MLPGFICLSSPDGPVVGVPPGATIIAIVAVAFQSGRMDAIIGKIFAEMSLTLVDECAKVEHHVLAY